MDKKTTSWLAYLTWIGLVVAFVAGDKEGAKFHLNQALVIFLGTFALGAVYFVLVLSVMVLAVSRNEAAAKVMLCVAVGVCVLGGIFLWICWIVGFVAAIRQKETRIPLLGRIRLLK